jgi:xylulokinase
LIQPLFLGLDLGTTAVKGVLTEADGTVLARASIERHPRYPRPGWVEMDAETDWWQPAAAVIRQLTSQAGPRGNDILCVGVCGLVPCLCLLDEGGHPLRPAILYSDNRALVELEWANRSAGLSLTAEAVIPKLLWVKHHEPLLYQRARQAVSAHHFVVRRLTGRACIDYDTASILGGIFRAGPKLYDPAVLNALGLSADLWPELLPATAAVGGVSASAARETGLPEGTTVIAGSGDTFPNIIGCGAVNPGDAMVAIGTSGLLTLTLRPLLESVMGPHFDDGSGRASVQWAANVLSAGQLANWWASQTGQANADQLNDLEALAALVPPGADGLTALPHWLGRRTPAPNPDLRGALIGLTPSHSKGHIYRALLESFAYNLRQGYEPIRPLVQRVVATGGGAASPLWRQILADVLEVEIEYYLQASGALGMAFLAAWASGAVHEFDTVRESWLRAAERSLPDALAQPFYRTAFEQYNALDRALELVFKPKDAF